MKRIIACLLVLVFLFSFVGCKDSKSKAPSGAASSTVAGKGKEATKESKKDKKSKDKSSGNDVDESTSKGADKDDASKKESASEKDTSSKNEDSKSSDKKDSKSSNSDSKSSGKTNTSNSDSKQSDTNKSDSSSSGGGSSSSGDNQSSTPTDENDALRKQIENTYGVTINYGDEKVLVSGYYIDYYPGTPGQYSVTRLSDSTKINKCLSELSTVLAGYPSGFFKDFKNFGSPITFLLLESSNAFSGFADSSHGDSLIVSLVYSDIQFSFTANHEIMHCIDKYLSLKLYDTGVKQYDAYKALNPAGFQYSYDVETYESYAWPTEYEKYCYSVNGAPNNGETLYFISTYALNNVREDRAELFKYMMRQSYIPSYIMTKNSVTKAKADVIAQQIQTYFPSASGGLPYWEKNKKILT